MSTILMMTMTVMMMTIIMMLIFLLVLTNIPGNIFISVDVTTTSCMAMWRGGGTAGYAHCRIHSDSTIGADDNNQQKLVGRQVIKTHVLCTEM